MGTLLACERTANVTKEGRKVLEGVLQTTKEILVMNKRWTKVDDNIFSFLTSYITITNNIVLVKKSSFVEATKLK